MAAYTLLADRREHQRATISNARRLALAAKAEGQRALAAAQQAQSTEGQRIAQSAIDLADKTVRQADLELVHLERVTEGPPRGTAPVFLLPDDDHHLMLSEARGTVLEQRAGDDRWVPVDLRRPLSAGDKVRTGRNSSVVIVLHDRTLVTLDENSTFSLDTQEPSHSEDVLDLLQGGLHYLHTGREPDRSTVVSPSGVMTVRGTEYDFAYDADGLSHFKPYSGKVELTAKARVPPRNGAPPWWLDHPVSTTLGNAATLPPQATGVRQFRVEDCQASLGPDGTLRASRLGTPPQPVYVLSTGRLHIDCSTGTRSTESVLLLTPNAVAELHGAAVDVSIADGGLADFVPLAGSLIVTAKLDQLDVGKLPIW